MKLLIEVNKTMYGGSDGKIDRVIINSKQGILVLHKNSKRWVLNNKSKYKEKGFIDGNNYDDDLEIIDKTIPSMLGE